MLVISQPMQPTLKKEGKNTVLKKPFSMRVRQSCVLTLSSTQSTLKRERAEKGGTQGPRKRGPAGAAGARTRPQGTASSQERAASSAAPAAANGKGRREE